MEVKRAFIDVAVFREYAARGLITCRPHPTAALVIWNYTPKCQYEYAWDEVTMQARGLITTLAGEIIARPFKKFMNLDQYQGDLPLEPFTVTTKMDGSLGILFFLDGKPQIATRGSFTSPQAQRANEILARYSAFPFSSEYTYLFEIIYAANRIVVDYGQTEELILLAVIHTETGREEDIYGSAWASTWPMPVIKRYDSVQDLAELRLLEEENAEGFVIRFASGLRLKFKFAEYVRLHHLLTQVNARIIWDLLRNHQPFDALLEKVPDEFYTWVRQTRENLEQQFTHIEGHCRAVLLHVKDLPTRKEQAAHIKQAQYPGVVFAMLDAKPYQDIIWKVLRPLAERPFREDSAA